MGIRRNLGAALTMGTMATTKLKDAQGDLETQVELYQSAADEFCKSYERTVNKFEEMNQAWDEAKEEMISSGALRVSDSGNLELGWLNTVTPGGGQDPETQRSTAEGVGGSVVSIGATVGAPVIAWSMIGALGTASTGAAISGLSGAAATSATAAWFGGGAVAAGGLGMAAAPFALSGIGVIVGLPVHIAIGAKVAGRSERKNLEKIDEHKKRIKARSAYISEHEVPLKQILPEATDTTRDLIGQRADLHTMSEFLEKGNPKLVASAELLLETMAKAQGLCARMRNISDNIHPDLGTQESECKA